MGVNLVKVSELKKISLERLKARPIDPSITSSPWAESPQKKPKIDAIQTPPKQKKDTNDCLIQGHEPGSEPPSTAWKKVDFMGYDAPTSGVDTPSVETPLLIRN